MLLNNGFVQDAASMKVFISAVLFTSDYFRVLLSKVFAKSDKMGANASSNPHFNQAYERFHACEKEQLHLIFDQITSSSKWLTKQKLYVSATRYVPTGVPKRCML